MIALWATASAGIVEEGAAALEAGNLDRAIAAWEAAGDAPSGVVHYDLGTAYLLKGEPVAALPHLVAAARYRPRDRDVQQNLAVARALLARDTAGDPVRVPDPADPVPALVQIATPGELAGIGLAAGLAGSALAPFRARVGRPLVALLVGVGIGLAATALWMDRTLAEHPLAVAVSATVLRDAPEPEAASLGDLPPGSELRVEREVGGFLGVVDGRGRRGFVPREAAPPAW